MVNAIAHSESKSAKEVDTKLTRLSHYSFSSINIFDSNFKLLFRNEKLQQKQQLATIIILNMLFKTLNRLNFKSVEVVKSFVRSIVRAKCALIVG